MGGRGTHRRAVPDDLRRHGGWSIIDGGRTRLPQASAKAAVWMLGLGTYDGQTPEIVAEQAVYNRTAGGNGNSIFAPPLHAGFRL